jgi:hypothetical protein
MTIKPIKTERDYQKGLKEIEKLWEAKPNTPTGDRLDVLLRWSKRMSRSITRSIHPTRLKPSSSVWNSLILSHRISLKLLGVYNQEDNQNFKPPHPNSREVPQDTQEWKATPPQVCDSGCSKGSQMRGARETDERRRACAVRWSKAVERNEAGGSFSTA